MGKSHNIRENNPNWKGGRYKKKLGYIVLNLPDHPKSTRNNHEVYEHRVVVEKHIGRFLKGSECVHHINGKRDDNRISNLMLFKNAQEHKKFENKVTQFGLTRPIRKQIKERWEIK